MNVQFAHTAPHTPAQVREILREAHAIAAELQRDGIPYGAVFREACRLLGARASVAIPEQPLPIDLAAVRRGAHG